MGKSLFGQLKGLLSRQKKSDLGETEAPTSSVSNLSRIGLSTANEADMHAADPAQQEQAVHDPSVQMTPATAQAMPEQQDASPASIQFFAEVPLQQSAEEIVNVSQRGSNCLEATMTPAGDGNWSVSITLRMLAVPQQIHNVESMLADWAGKLGGTSKGWGLAQGKAA
jgi:hypothetical protein